MRGLTWREERKEGNDAIISSKMKKKTIKTPVCQDSPFFHTKTKDISRNRNGGKGWWGWMWSKYITYMCVNIMMKSIIIYINVLIKMWRSSSKRRFLQRSRVNEIDYILNILLLCMHMCQYVNVIHRHRREIYFKVLSYNTIGAKSQICSDGNWLGI